MVLSWRTEKVPFKKINGLIELPLDWAPICRQINSVSVDSIDQVLSSEEESINVMDK
jgi:hypothetical protein